MDAVAAGDYMHRLDAASVPVDQLSNSSDDVLSSDIEHLDSSEEENFNCCRHDSHGDFEFVDSDDGECRGGSDVNEDDMDPITHLERQLRMWDDLH